MDRTFVIVASALGFLGVALGAFGAHALRDTLTPRDLEIFETAVRYQLIHAVALLGVAAAAARWPDVGTLLSASGWLMVGGVVVFSGSLYTLVSTGVRSFGAITPIGGVALLAGWATLGWAALRSGG
ncbi:MAG: DUF423 domain-containing protein [Gemmatimonadetes bacterium]|nr:DUF423 domain-containing protein [Gemmatimonadota bacterium]